MNGKARRENRLDPKAIIDHREGYRVGNGGKGSVEINDSLRYHTRNKGGETMDPRTKRKE